MQAAIRDQARHIEMWDRDELLARVKLEQPGP
jgi:hypothetical protein